MGNIDKDFDLDPATEVRLPKGVVVFANATELDGLRDGTPPRRFDGWTLVALPADAPLPADAVAGASLLIIEVDPAEPASLQRLSQAREAWPNLPVIAAIPDANVTLVRMLVRQGVADVTTLPFVESDLIAQVLDVSARLTETRVDVRLAPMTAVVRSTGGCGVTSVITHLAAALAQDAAAGSRVCVVDLDLQGGDVASYLGLVPRQTVSMLLEAVDRLDSELLKSAITDSGRGFAVIAAPEIITPLESVDMDQLLRLLELVRQEYDHVLIELPTDWTSWALSAAVAASEVLLITDLSIGSLRQAKRRLDLLASVDLGKDRIRAVVNRAERRLFKTIGVEDVRDALLCDVAGALAAEGAALTAAQDQGMLITEVNRRSRFGADIRTLANQLAGHEE